MPAKTNLNKAPEVIFLPWGKRDRLDSLIERSAFPSSISRGEYLAIKMHFGERGGDGHVKPEFVRPFIKIAKSKKAKPFLTDTCTIYHGPRNNAVEHLMVAAEHGFSLNKLQIPVIIADGLLGDDYEEIAIPGKHFPKVNIATGITNADRMLVISHFKGHILTGFGGAIKNIGMGCGSRKGKFEMHSSAAPTVTKQKCVGCGLCIPMCAQNALKLSDGKISLDKKLCAGCGECIIACHTAALSITWNEETKNVQERLAEYALGAVKDIPSYYFNFVCHITPNCDCMGIKEKPIAADVGILASKDPVAIDAASLDLVIKNSGDVFKKAHPELDGRLQLEYAEKIGLGSRKYKLVEL